MSWLVSRKVNVKIKLTIGRYPLKPNSKGYFLIHRGT